MFILLGFVSSENVGTVLVTDDGKLRGIVIDRQIATKIVAAGKDPAKVRVSEDTEEFLSWKGKRL